MVTGMNRERRVAALETLKRQRGPMHIPLIAARVGETSEDAVARYVADHGPLEEVHEGETNIIVMMALLPNERTER